MFIWSLFKLNIPFFLQHHCYISFFFFFLPKSEFSTAYFQSINVGFLFLFLSCTCPLPQDLRPIPSTPAEVPSHSDQPPQRFGSFLACNSVFNWKSCRPIVASLSTCFCALCAGTGVGCNRGLSAKWQHLGPLCALKTLMEFKMGSCLPETDLFCSSRSTVSLSSLPSLSFF